MSLAPGTRLGTYEILGPLGAGGMGEVYRARDGRLARHVAIKVLPPALSADPVALARFEQEAKAVAALSHPNILAIYDFAGEGGTTYAVMELLEGSTMRARLEEGPLPFRKAVELAAEAALGLAAAHEKGIVHRDLKPENLFLTADGRLKILDFGLARQTAPIDQAATQSPTVAPSTEPGTVLGTVGYMSPEQVRGRVADARSDIFSLGVVLLEMVTGRRAFQRETAAETMTAILREDPAGLDSGIPAPLEQILRHCLGKSPDERFRSARDLAFALQAIVGTGSDRSGASSGASPVAPSPAPAVRPLRSGRPLAAALLVALLALSALAAGFFLGRRPGTRSPGGSGTLHAVSFQQLTDTVGVESAPSLAPDGKSFVFVSSAAGKLNIYAQRVGGRNATLLTGDSGSDDRQPAFSPDGERIAFRSERDGGGIFVMGSTGESVKRLTDFGFNPTWSPDGKEVAVARGTFYYPTDRNAMSGGLVAVNVETGRTRVVSEAGDVMQPAWSPHGKRLAFWGLKGRSGQRDLFTVAADGSEAKSAGLPVTDDPPLDWSPTWSPDGRFLWFSSNRGGSMNLWRVPIDEASGRALGEPEPMTTPSLWSGEVSISRDGSRMAFSSVLWRSTILKAAFDAKEERVVGSPVPILGGTQPIRDHEVSPDGEWVAFDTIASQEDLWVARLDGTQYRRLTDDRFRDRGPTWSPDGKEIAFYSDRSGSYQVWTIHPDGSGLAQRTSVDGSSVHFPEFSPDGSKMSLGLTTSSRGWILLDWSSREEKPPARLMPTVGKTESFWPQSWTPDGARVAGPIGHANGTVGRVVAYDLSKERYDVLYDGGDTQWKFVTWLRDGHRLVLRDSRGIWLLDPAAKRVRPLVAVRGYCVGRSVGITGNDRFLTWTETGTEGDIWLAELK